MQDSPTPYLKKQPKHKPLFNTPLFRLLVLLSVAITHAILIFHFMQKHATQRRHYTDSYAVRKIINIGFPDGSKFAKKNMRSAASISLTVIRPSEHSAETNPESEKSTSRLGQETPEQAVYIMTEQLTEEPTVQIDLHPDIAIRLGNNINRIAILRLRIDELGTIDQVLVEQSDFSEAEIKLLITACEEMKFSPGKIGKIPVKSEMRIEMTIPALTPNPPLH